MLLVARRNKWRLHQATGMKSTLRMAKLKMELKTWKMMMTSLQSMMAKSKLKRINREKKGERSQKKRH